MKQNIKTVALFIGLSMLAVGCQKETIVDNGTVTETLQAYINVDYTIDGVDMHATFNDEASWQEFLHWMFTLAEKGHRVSFGDSNRVQGVTKETVTYTTQSRFSRNGKVARRHVKWVPWSCAALAPAPS